MALFGTDNMMIYNRVRAVPQEAQKSFSNGSFNGTDVNPMWRIQTLTEVFGPAGIGWYYEVLSERAETYGDTVMAIVDLNLYVKIGDEWSKPIYGTGGNLLVQMTKSGPRPSDEGYKKALTDALSIACKALGVAADIWYSKGVNVDPTMKYATNQPAPVPAPKREPIFCEKCGNPILDVTKRGGEVWAAEDISAYTKKKFGYSLCGDCAKKAAKSEA